MTTAKEDWLLRPVLAGHIRYESLLGTELSLYDLLLLHEAMDCKEENDNRLLRAAESRARMRRR